MVLHRTSASPKYPIKIFLLIKLCNSVNKRKRFCLGQKTLPWRVNAPGPRWNRKRPARSRIQRRSSSHARAKVTTGRAFGAAARPGTRVAAPRRKAPDRPLRDGSRRREGRGRPSQPSRTRFSRTYRKTARMAADPVAPSRAARPALRPWGPSRHEARGLPSPCLTQSEAPTVRGSGPASAPRPDRIFAAARSRRRDV